MFEERADVDQVDAIKVADRLIARLAGSGLWPEPELLEEILAQGEYAVRPLLGLIRRVRDRQAEQGCLPHAVCLLGSLRTPEAIAPLASLLCSYEDTRRQTVADALVQLGPAVVRPMLELFADLSVSWESRLLAMDVAVEVAGEDLRLRAMVAPPLRELLRECLSRDDNLWRSASEPATAAAEYLASLQDEEAGLLIETAFATDLIDEMVFSRDDWDDALRGKASPSSCKSNKNKLQDWLRSYRSAYRRHADAPSHASDQQPLTLP